MKNIKKSLLTSMLMLSLFGCSAAFYNEPDTRSLPSTAEDSFAALSQSPTCCDSLQSLPLESLRINTQIYTILEAGKPQININGHESFASAYVLPQSDKAQRIDVAAMVVENTVLAPAISLYDASWNSINQIDAASFSYSPAKFGDFDRLETTVDLTSSQNRQARYLVIHSDHNAFYKKIPLTHPEELYSERRGIIPMKRNKEHAVLVPTGLVRLTLKPQNIITTLFSGNHTEQSVTTDSVNSYSRVTGVVGRTEEVAPEQRYKAIKQAIKEQDFATALRLVETSERDGDMEARYLFIQELEQINIEKSQGK